MRRDKNCIEVEVFPMHNHKHLSGRGDEDALRTARSRATLVRFPSTQRSGPKGA